LKDFKDFENMAMFDLPETERKVLKERFDEIKIGISAVDAQDTQLLQTLVSPLNYTNIIREDVCEKFFSGEELLLNAPEQKDGYFQVPAAID